MKLTKSIIYAAAMDAYKAGLRSGLSQDAAGDLYHAEFDRLFAAIGGVEAWIDLP